MVAIDSGFPRNNVLFEFRVKFLLVGDNKPTQKLDVIVINIFSITTFFRVQDFRVLILVPFTI